MYNMNTKSPNLFENNPKVEEIKFYLRWSKRLFAFLLAVVFVNLILTYGLIFHPSKPSVSTCAKYCLQIHDREAIDPSSGFTTSLLPPIETEVTVHEGSETTALATRSAAEIDERFDYGDVKTGVALAMAGYWVTNQAIQWWNMVAACQDFGNASNTINCLWGAVTTVITAAGSMYAAYVGAGRIQTWFNNNGVSIGWKRDEVDQELLDEFSKVFGVDVAHLGVWDYSHLGLGGTLGTRDSAAPLDVFGFTTQSGADMHFSYLGNTTNGLGFKFGWGLGPNNNTKVKGRGESFDQQYFSSGGIDFVINQNTEDGGKLDTYSDYWWMYDQVACIMAPGMTAAGHWFQIYDNVQRGTIAEGAVAPFRGSDHWSAISVMNNEPTPLLTNSACE